MGLSVSIACPVVRSTPPLVVTACPAFCPVGASKIKIMDVMGLFAPFCASSIA